MMKRASVWLTALCTILFLMPGTALANHPVLVEGETDFDGDGRLGTDEDNDGADQVFGTINAALGAADAGANQNGLVLIVTSGRFPEPIVVTGVNGNVQIQAAPGVEALLDAVMSGDPGSGPRQGMVGITVDSPLTRRVTLRNLTIRNWAEGIHVMGNSRVVIENCNVDQNLNYGIRMTGKCNAVIRDCSVTGTGFRRGGAGDAPEVDPPSPGNGISFEVLASGVLASTLVAQNFNFGVANRTSRSIAFADLITTGNGSGDRVGRLVNLN